MTEAETEGLVDLGIEAPEWEAALPDIAALAAVAAGLALAEAGLDANCWSLCVVACDDERIAALNRDFRGKDAPTNVLSWPAFPLAPTRPGAAPPPPPAPPAGHRGHLGDVAIALQTTRREAADAAIPLKDHFVHLILHGCLHLLGFDHETEADAELMEGIERRALAGIGVPDPYVQRDAGQPHPDS